MYVYEIRPCSSNVAMWVVSVVCYQTTFITARLLACCATPAPLMCNVSSRFPRQQPGHLTELPRTQLRKPLTSREAADPQYGLLELFCKVPLERL